MKHNQTNQKNNGFPGLIISALRGGSGKTIFSVGIIAALHQRGNAIAPFKKGPDYIDAGWLALAAGQPCYNLDTFLINSETILNSFLCYTRSSDMAVIEGNRGLYDSPEIEGNTSTAELAKLLNLPVVLCIDGTKTTRTMAAVVSGCQQFDTDVKIQGVVLNRMAGERHQSNLRKCIEHYCNIPVLGAVPKLKEQTFPERHMGLVPTHEHSWAKESIASIAAVVSQYVDLDAILKIASADAGGLSKCMSRKRHDSDAESSEAASANHVVEICPKKYDRGEKTPKIGVIRDSAFQFYYPENLEALEAAGAEIVFTSPLKEKMLPKVDGLYIGGGFPETHAAQLAENKTYRQQIKALADRGLPIYAECGGLMYLGEALLLEGISYPMANIFSLIFGLYRRPQGHGYTIQEVVHDNPFFEVGSEIKGHEFHYSKAIEYRNATDKFVFRVKRGVGLAEGKDGICHKNVLATYTHIHALGTPLWAKALVEKAVSYKVSKEYV